MLGPGLRLFRSFALAGAELAVDVGRVVGADDLFDVEPHQFRRLLLTFEETIQGQIPEILGDTEEERVDTLVRLLRGTSEEDLNTLLESLQVALAHLDRERRRDDRRRAERRRELRAARHGHRHPAPFVREVTDESRYA
jgi:hypothetical protein